MSYCKDEFYTLYSDVKAEIECYKSQLKGKTIYCNCDDDKSAFYRYFKDNFQNLGLKQVLASTILSNTVWSFNGHKETTINYNSPIDFRHNISLSILSKADIVITNPPFSLLDEFVSLMIQNNKDFIIIGNNNMLTYKRIFKLFKEGKIHFGKTHNTTFNFVMSSDYECRGASYIDEQGRKIAKVPSVSWFTSFNLFKASKIVLTTNYDENKYRKYDNYDAINVNSVAEIPYNYYGIMGVPISYLNVHNPEQFELLGIGTTKEHFTPTKQYDNPIKHFKDSESVVTQKSINNTLVYKLDEAELDSYPSYYTADNIDYKLYQPYARVLIRAIKND